MNAITRAALGVAAFALSCTAAFAQKDTADAIARYRQLLQDGNPAEQAMETVALVVANGSAGRRHVCNEGQDADEHASREQQAAAQQAEAARAIGLNFREVLGTVVIPQALRTVVGPIGNLYIANGKNTVIGTTIGLFVETTAAQRLANSTGQPIAAFAAAAIFFVVWLLIAAQVFTSIEQRVAFKR